MPSPASPPITRDVISTIGEGREQARGGIDGRRGAGRAPIAYELQ
jgi:hypothetical protein